MKLSGQSLSLSDLARVAHGHVTVSIDPSVIPQIEASRRVIENIVETDQVVYGVNTGFGKLANTVIPKDQTDRLQLNLVRSHACGVGEPLSEPEARAMLLLRANVLCKGFSGVRPVVIETLVEMLNKGVHPVIPSRGSVGASGDLAPLAHMTLVLIGEGEAWFKGERMNGGKAMLKAGIAPLTLKAKEGLALLNGTQAMTAVGGLAVAEAQSILTSANLASAMSLEALLGTPTAFDSRIHSARGQVGQSTVAAFILDALEGSELRKTHLEGDSRVQDAYCLRCVPQVHGGVLDTLNHAKNVLEIETGAATDNPLVFTDTSDVLSGGNFHGAPLAYVLDFAAIALTDLMSISERRIDKMLGPDFSEEVPGGHLPSFLSQSAGISSGFMIAHVTAVALLNECKVLSHPSSVDSSPTSAGKEDHVSMGMTGALKLRQVVDHAARVIAVELMCASEALDHRKKYRTSPKLESVKTEIRKIVAPLTEDRALSNDIENLAMSIKSAAIL